MYSLTKSTICLPSANACCYDMSSLFAEVQPSIWSVVARRGERLHSLKFSCPRVTQTYIWRYAVWCSLCFAWSSFPQSFLGLHSKVCRCIIYFHTRIRTFDGFSSPTMLITFYQLLHLFTFSIMFTYFFCRYVIFLPLTKFRHLCLDFLCRRSLFMSL